MGAMCPDCGTVLLTNPGLTTGGQCLNCGYPTKRTVQEPASPPPRFEAEPLVLASGTDDAKPAKPPTKPSDVERLRLMADVATEVWLCRHIVNQITATDARGNAALTQIVGHLDEARKLFEQASIPYPSLNQEPGR